MYIKFKSNISIENNNLDSEYENIKWKPTSNLAIPAVVASTASFIELSFLLTLLRPIDFLSLAAS